MDGREEPEIETIFGLSNGRTATGFLFSIVHVLLYASRELEGTRAHRRAGELHDCSNEAAPEKL